MKPELRITVLVENTVYRPGLLAEHGLSLWIEYRDKCFLFDTGQSNILLHNAHTLDINLHRTDAVILSHGHYDHTGGLDGLLLMIPGVPIYGHPLALTSRYYLRNNKPRPIGMATDIKEQLTNTQGPQVFKKTEQVTEILPGMTVTGTIPLFRQDEVSIAGFYLDPEGTSPDAVQDDQALMIDTKRGVVVVLGCAHVGVMNTLDFVKTLISGRSICAVIGGMHLKDGTPQRLAETQAYLERLDVDIIAPGHCTGPEAIAYFREGFSGRCRPCVTGMCYQF